MTMHLFSLAAIAAPILLALLPPRAAASDAGKAVLGYTPLSAAPSSPQPFATLSRSGGANYTLASFEPPKSPIAAPHLVRVGLLASRAGSGFIGSSTLAWASVLTRPDAWVMRVLLGGSGDIVGVSFYPEDGGSEGAGAHGGRPGVREKGDGKGKEGAMRIEVVPAAPEPKAVLNRPVVLNADGNAEEEEQPKTLLQRYWWVLVAVLLATLLGGGGDGK